MALSNKVAPVGTLHTTDNLSETVEAVVVVTAGAATGGAVLTKVDPKRAKVLKKGQGCERKGGEDKASLKKSFLQPTSTFSFFFIC